MTILLISGIIIFSMLLSTEFYLNGVLKSDGYKIVSKRETYAVYLFYSFELLVGIIMLVAWLQTSSITLIKNIFRIHMYLLCFGYGCRNLYLLWKEKKYIYLIHVICLILLCTDWSRLRTMALIVFITLDIFDTIRNTKRNTEEKS